MFLRLFDSPNVLSCYRRSDSVMPQQALALANSSLCLEQARLLAGKLERGLADSHEAGLAHDTAFVIAAFERVLGRPPTRDELAACADYLRAAPGSSPIGRAWPPFPAARPPPSPLRPTRPSAAGKTWFTCSSTITILSRSDDDMITRRCVLQRDGDGSRRRGLECDVTSRRACAGRWCWPGRPGSRRTGSPTSRPGPRTSSGCS